MSETLMAVRCLYCEHIAKLVTDKDKNYLDCKNCGKRELTKLGLARLKARKA
jgi:DNA-directed RNA polymerase subunit RPC12/RpoP